MLIYVFCPPMKLICCSKVHVVRSDNVISISILTTDAISLNRDETVKNKVSVTAGEAQNAPPLDGQRKMNAKFTDDT